MRRSWLALPIMLLLPLPAAEAKLTKSKALSLVTQALSKRAGPCELGSARKLSAKKTPTGFAITARLQTAGEKFAASFDVPKKNPKVKGTDGAAKEIVKNCDADRVAPNEAPGESPAQNPADLTWRGLSYIAYEDFQRGFSDHLIEGDLSVTLNDRWKGARLSRVKAAGEYDGSEDPGPTFGQWSDFPNEKPEWVWSPACTARPQVVEFKRVVYTLGDPVSATVYSGGVLTGTNGNGGVVESIEFLVNGTVAWERINPTPGKPGSWPNAGVEIPLSAQALNLFDFGANDLTIRVKKLETVGNCEPVRGARKNDGLGVSFGLLAKHSADAAVTLLSKPLKGPGGCTPCTYKYKLANDGPSALIEPKLKVEWEADAFAVTGSGGACTVVDPNGQGTHSVTCLVPPLKPDESVDLTVSFYPKVPDEGDFRYDWTMRSSGYGYGDGNAENNGEYTSGGVCRGASCPS